MEKPPFKFQVGDEVVIGDTVWSFSGMKSKKGQIGTITRTGYINGFGNGNHYEIDGLYYFEEDCLTLHSIEKITNDEINNILQG